MTSKSKNKSHSRAPGMTQVSISLPERLVRKIDELAEKEKRSRSNYIAYVIESLPIDNVDAGPQLLHAAESK